MRERLQPWLEANKPEDELIYKAGPGDQAALVRRLARLVGRGLPYETICTDVVWVISTHRSKSVTLPVFEVARPDGSLRLVLRDNFYNWKLSVISEVPIDLDPEGLFAASKAEDPCGYLSPVYFEGFPDDLIFSYYADDKRRWSAEIQGNNALWAVVFLVCREAGRRLGWKAAE